MENFSFLREETVKVPAGVWLLAGFLALAERFYHLTSLSLWPTRDDGYYAFSPMEFNQGGDFPFFYGIGEILPPFRFLLALCFKVLGTSLFSLWFFPALVSLATVGLGWWVLRPRTSRTFSFIFVFLLAAGFWPLCLGRFCNIWVLLFFWEILSLGLLTAFFQSGSGQINGRAIGLGLCAGAGFYVSPNHWSFMALALTFIILKWTTGNPKRKWKHFFLYLASASAAGLLFAVEGVVHSYGRHVQEVWPGVGSFFSLANLSKTGLYLSGLFWGFASGDYNYGPAGGGFLNPLIGAFFFTGLACFLRRGRLFELKWVGAIFFILMLPGFLTRDLEMQRVVLVMPLLFLAAGAGMICCLSGIPKRLRVAVLLGVLVLSAGIDFYRLAGPLSRALNPDWEFHPSNQSEESFKAFRVLKQKAGREGPGLLFLDYVSVPMDQSLSLAAFPFDAVRNPELKGTKANWMAFLTNVNYRPFLEKRFPEAEWVVLGSRLLPWDGELMLGILPVNSRNQTAADLWLKAQPVFHGMTVGIFSQPEGRSRKGILDKALMDYSLVRDDPFLESAFWEIFYFNHSSDKNFQASESDLEMVMKKGYPAAHIYNELGGLLYFKKDLKGAGQAFARAFQMGQGHTLAGENLRLLEDGKK